LDSIFKIWQPELPDQIYVKRTGIFFRKVANSVYDVNSGDVLKKEYFCYRVFVRF
jgi:hypothetical protein